MISPGLLQLADAVLGVMLIEGIALSLYAVRRGRGMPVHAIWGMLLPGALLVAAARMALGGAYPGPVMLVLAAALVAHVVDLCWRWGATVARSPENRPVGPAPVKLGTR